VPIFKMGQIRLSRFFLRFFLVSSYRIRAMDYFAFAVASLLLFRGCNGSELSTSRRAAQIDPIIALRQE
jgi:hypothetical protein